MPLEKDQAVVVRLTEYSETSQIVTVFAATHGLLRLIAKGARRSTRKRFAAGLDLLERGDVSFAPAHGDAQLGTLTEWTQRDTFPGLRREMLRLYGGMYAIELVAQLTEEGDPHPGLYEALVRILQGLAESDTPSELIPDFQERFLQAIGYAPTLDRCASCSRVPGRRQPLFFSADAGGLVCRDCEQHFFDKRRLPAGLLASSPQHAAAVEAFELFDHQLTHIAGRRFQTAEQLGRLLAAAERR